MIFEIALYTLMVALVVFALKPKNVLDFAKKICLNKIDKLIPFLSGVVKNTFFLIVASIVVGLFFSIIGMGEDASIVSELLRQMPFYDILISIFFACIAEEIFFRGYLLQKTNIWIATFLFAISHMGYGSVTEVIGAFVLGLILANQFLKTKNLWSVIFTHLAYNVFVLVSIFSVTI